MPAPKTTVDRLAPERELWARGLRQVAGVDEAGRGPLAGPVVVAAVILPCDWASIPPEYAALNDSKQLTEEARERFFELLTRDFRIVHAIVEVDHLAIDRLNILRATHHGMAEALRRLQITPEHALIDGRPVPGLPCTQTALVKGDARSYSIAAASVLAKVTRDRFMLAADQLHPGYGFAQHKGYPTPEHLEAVRRLGPCPLHRRSFAPLRPAQAELFPP